MRFSKRLCFALVLLVLACSPVGAQAAKSKGPMMAEVLAGSSPGDWRTLDPENTLYMELPGGRVVIELAPAFAPNHVANVKALAREHYYDGLAIIRAQDNYVVQWADPNAEKPRLARKIEHAHKTLPAEFERPYDSKLPFTRLPDKDTYAPEVGFCEGFPVARDRRTGKEWLVHCYGMVGAGRDTAPDSGGGTELYAVIGQAPRHLDRNVTLLGRVVQGMELLSSLPRGTGALGFHEKPEQCVPIKSIRVAADVPVAERSDIEIVRTGTATFRALIEARRNRREPWFVVPAGHVEIGNVPVPVRLIAKTAGDPARPPKTAEDLKVGLIGLDTSHVVEFTRRLNDSSDKEFIPGARVVAAFKGGSEDIPESWNRVEGYTKTLREKYGVKMEGSIDDLLKDVDVVMIESLDGRPHLREATPVIEARKPLFVDKPLAGSLKDALAIYRLAREKGVPIYSGSSLRFYPNLQTMKATDVGRLEGAFSCGPCALEPHHPDLFWYGIHPTEALYTIMGPGCETVTCTATADSHVVTGVWKDGKVGTLWGLHHGSAPYRVTVFGTKKTLDEALAGNYTPFLREVVKFFQTGAAPVPPEETLEIYAFMEAADESKRQGGGPVRISDVMQKNGGEEK